MRTASKSTLEQAAVQILLWDENVQFAADIELQRSTVVDALFEPLGLVRARCLR